MSSFPCSRTSCLNSGNIQCECPKSNIFCDYHFPSHFLTCASFFRILENQDPCKPFSSENSRIDKFILTLFQMVHGIMLEIVRNAFDSSKSNFNQSIKLNKEITILNKEILKKSINILASILNDISPKCPKETQMNCARLKKDLKYIKKKLKISSLIQVISLFTDYLSLVQVTLLNFYKNPDNQNKLETTSRTLVTKIKDFIKNFSVLTNDFELFYLCNWQFDDHDAQETSNPGRNQKNLKNEFSNSKEESKNTQKTPEPFFQSENKEKSSESSSKMLTPEKNIEFYQKDSLVTTPSSIASSNSSEPSNKFIENTKINSSSSTPDNSKCSKCQTLKSIQQLPCGHYHCVNCSSEETCTICLTLSKCEPCKNTLLKCEDCSKYFCNSCLSSYQNNQQGGERKTLMTRIWELFGFRN